jgi:hypothetical protein
MYFFPFSSPTSVRYSSIRFKIRAKVDSEIKCRPSFDHLLMNILTPVDSKDDKPFRIHFLSYIYLELLPRWLRYNIAVPYKNYIRSSFSLKVQVVTRVGVIFLDGNARSR